ncbi:hypothetical protein H9P43_000438 [Blastocladiella emersonii ATCC 22665]|nr:hypothetical protein H9P43_000438 [Blastocladiella emersonii ATCC 22665]
MAHYSNGNMASHQHSHHPLPPPTPAAVPASAASSYWVQLKDPDTGEPWYANPDTGECVWQLTPDMRLLDGAGAEVWWQLFDERQQTPYYYSTRSGVTQWPRPDSGLVINLSTIQKHAIGKRVSLAYQPIQVSDYLPREDSSGSQRHVVPLQQPSSHHHHPQQQQQQQPRPQQQPQPQPQQPFPRTLPSSTSSNGGSRYMTPGAGAATPIAIPSSGSSTGLAGNKRPSNLNLIDDHALLDLVVVDTPIDDDHIHSGIVDPAASVTAGMSSSAPVLSHLQDVMGARRHHPQYQHLTDPPMSAGPLSTPHSNPLADPVGGGGSGAPATMTAGPSARTSTFLMSTGDPVRLLQKSASTTDLAKSSGISQPIPNPSAAAAMHPLARPATMLPTELQRELSQFRIDGFAKKYFREQKRGFFRRRVPVEKLLVWSKESLRLPLMVISKPQHKDALKCFKLVQRIMGDRTAPRGYKPTTDIMWILDKGVTSGEMRDEIYVQVCKQLTANPSPASVRQGWNLMACLVPCFPPSKNFEHYLQSFIAGYTTHADYAVVASHCLRRLERSCKMGPRGKVPTAPEIERMLEAPYAPSVFGETLEDIMRLQRQEYPHLVYPRLLVFLAQKVLDLGGCTTEGIFRVPGDADAITDLRLRLEKNRYDVTGIADANVPAGLLKFWLRELAEPLIPENLYQACIANADSPEHALAIVDQLPPDNCRVAKYMIAFLQIFAQPKFMAATKMTVQNLAMVYAPNFLRCPSNDPTKIFENTKYEQQFLRHLISDARYDDIDVRAVPWQ